MFGPRKASTGIDLGTESVKLVRGEGTNRIERFTHLGIEDWDPAESGNPTERAAGALRRLLGRLHLNRGSLGRIAVAVSGEETSIRDPILPALSESELRQALPFEVRKHLDIEEMTSPVLSFQILRNLPPAEEGGTARMRVLLAAVPSAHREFQLRVLERVGLEPQIIDIEPLAGLNALLAGNGANGENADVLGLLDLGARRAALHLTGREGGVLSRPVGPGAPGRDRSEAPPDYVAELVRSVRATLVFYRGRHHREVGRIALAGGGALYKGLPSVLAREIGLPVSRLNPLGEQAEGARGAEEAASAWPRFVTACGLCRWWDAIDV